MQPSSSRACAKEHSPARKNKTQSQREYRSKEMDGFSELRDALLLADPFDTPLGRDATRHQLLITAAQKLRSLADKNQELVLQLSATPTPVPHDPNMRTPHGVTAQNTLTTGVAWSPPGQIVERLLSATSEPISPFRDYGNAISEWLESSPLLHGHDYQPHDHLGLGSSYQVPPAADMSYFH